MKPTTILLIVLGLVVLTFTIFWVALLCWSVRHFYQEHAKVWFNRNRYKFSVWWHQRAGDSGGLLVIVIAIAMIVISGIILHHP